jgi:hypothetical protein
MSFDMKVTVDAKSLAFAVKQMRALPVAIAQQIEKKVLKAALDPILQDAIRRAPVGETGNLSNSIKIRTSKVGNTYLGEVRSTAPHAHLIEFGHRLMRGARAGRQKFIKWVPAKPFLRPAFLAQEQKILPIAEHEINVVLKAFEAAGVNF